MATITVTRSLPSLVGVFNVNTFEFTITEDVIPTVTIAGVAFSPVKTGTGSGVDTYVMDVTNILKHVLGLPMIELPTVSGITGEVEGMSASCTIAISGTGATTVNITTILTFMCSEIGADAGYDIYNYGRYQSTMFHHGQIMFFCKETGGNKVCTINGVNYTYLIANGWNLIDLHATHLINGVFTVAGTDISLGLTYIPVTNLVSIDWLNRDGCWSKVYLRKLGESYTNEKINTIPIYNVLSNVRAYNRNISANKKVSMSFDCVAKNEIHYKLLCEIADSLVVLIDNVQLVNVAVISKNVAECRQNLHFTITLQYSENVANY